MAFAGGLGVEIQLDVVPTADAILSPTTRLFSESNSRFLCEVAPEHAAVFEGQFTGLPIAPVGVVSDAKKLKIASGVGVLIDADIDQLKEAWQRPLRY
jgi:phosphoribosylformylglycinamidine synthase